MLKKYKTLKEKSDATFLTKIYRLDKKQREVHLDEHGMLKPTNFWRALPYRKKGRVYNPRRYLHQPWGDKGIRKSF